MIGPGNMKWSTARPMRKGLTILAIGFVGALTWASIAQIRGAVIASGNVEVESGRQAIQHPDGGMVAGIWVRDGERVDEGAAILELDSAELSSERSLLVRQFREVRAQVDRLSVEAGTGEELVFRDEKLATNNAVVKKTLAEERTLYDTGRELLMQTIAHIDERKVSSTVYIEGIKLQLEATQDQLALIETEARDKEALLAKNMIPRPEVLRLLREEARLRGVIGEMKAEIARGQSTSASYEIEKLRTLAEQREKAQSELHALQLREAEIAERLRVIETRLSRLVLRAPMAGIVHSLRVFTVGGVIPAGAEVAAIVPEGLPLVLNVRIDPGQIDEVHAGQDVTVVFQSFNTRTAPEFIGRVRTVSADTVVDEVTGLRFYTARVVLDAPSEEAARVRGILPGMPVDAYIQTRVRTPVDFLLDPFVDYIRHAFREE